MSPAFRSHTRYYGTIAVYGDYLPWKVHKGNGGDHSSYPEHSKRILDLKDGHQNAVTYFRDMVEPELRPGIVIVPVPSHSPAKTGGGLAKLAAALAAREGRIDGTGVLVRAKKIDKLAHGGNRDKQVHLDSIVVAHPDVIRGRSVLVIDDVAKTCHSLQACRDLLYRAGALTVECAVMGKT